MPSCEPIGTATLPGHALKFHKRSKDGSGKCNALAADDSDSVVGVLFSFDPTDREKLDRAEGVGNGYNHTIVTVINVEGRRRKVLTYLADAEHIDDSLKPYAWYKELVLVGAREHDLPTEYVTACIAPVEAIDDPNAARATKERVHLP